MQASMSSLKEEKNLWDVLDEQAYMYSTRAFADDLVQTLSKKARFVVEEGKLMDFFVEISSRSSYVRMSARR